MPLAAIFVALSIPLIFTAAETGRDEVMQVAVKIVAQAAQRHHQYPFIIASTTSPGAEHYVTEFVTDRYGAAIGEELAADFKEKTFLTRDLETTQVITLQHQPAGGWKPGLITLGKYEIFHRPDVYIHPPAR